jgi:DNA repair exonuclease SbcCD ATPase subunit
MKLIRLRVESFAAIGNVDVEFGPGLNVLYGPNDLGKSTMAESIRFALLLPHSSTHSEPYAGWTGAGDPVVELTFETEAQRIWRVRKQFGKAGSSLLEESRDGRDFDEVGRGRTVDGKLREILRWGIPEPGGAHGIKGLPTSFLATALLSTQADVSAILHQSLRDDPTGSGKEQIAAALQAVAQDPLFVELLRKTQERRDAAFTDRGAKKTAKGTIFKEAAERLNEARNEKESLQKIVEDSEGAERQLRDLNLRRAGKQEQCANAIARAASLQQLAQQATERSKAAELVRLAEQEVRRIKDLGTEVGATEDRVAELTRKVTRAKEAVDTACDRQKNSDAALASAREAAHTEEADPSESNTKLLLRRSQAEQATSEAQQRIDTLSGVKKLADTAHAAELAQQSQQENVKNVRKASTEAQKREQKANEDLDRNSLLERALEVQAAEKQLRAAQAAVDSQAALAARVEEVSREHVSLVVQRAAITVPSPGALAPMRKLATDLATARGALDVGFIATVTPHRPLELTVQRDGAAADSISTAQAQEIDANAELEIGIAGVATFRVRGGRREAQARCAGLENRWDQEVTMHLLAAGVTDLEHLSAKVSEAQGLDAAIKQKDIDLKSLQDQIARLSGVADALRLAADHVLARRAALGNAKFETLAAELAAVGSDATAKLVQQRQQLLKNADAARATANRAARDQDIAEERTRQLQSALETAISARDHALQPFPEGVDAALAAALAKHAACVTEKQKIASELASLDAQIDARKKRIDAAQRDARASAEEASAAVKAAQEELEAARTEVASENGRLMELRKRRDAENLTAAGDKLRQVTEHYDALPVPDRAVSNDEVMAAQSAVASLKSELDLIEGSIHRAHGALEQVGGAVARERLSDATDAFELAERLEREIEAEYEAWKLLLEQMKEADAAQASNLGLALVPAIADHFNHLTRQRYATVKLTAQLEMEGVVAAGKLRSASSLSVGTKEQLSTLFRLSLAEYLHTAIVLDDQLVQSDGYRMDWFRTLLKEKAQTFQIIVFTCRPTDYLAPIALVPEGSALPLDIDGARAIDLGRALRRR